MPRSTVAPVEVRYFGGRGWKAEKIVLDVEDEAQGKYVGFQQAPNLVTQRIPLGRWGVPSELGGAALFLAPEAGAYVNGHLLVVDGGMTVTLRSIALRLHGRQPESPRTSLCLESIPQYPDSADPNFANVARLHVWGRAVRAHPNHIARIEGQISGHGADISGHAK